MKVIRYLLAAILAVALLLVLAVGVVLFILDPNDFKPQIEKAVSDHTNLELRLEGDISWSLIPLGIEVNEVEVLLEGERFAAMNKLLAQVDFWSLLAMSPRVNTFVLDGLEAHLVMGPDGQGNWERIMPESEQADDSATPPAPETVADRDASPGTPLDFAVDDVRIINARIVYDDRAAGQVITLEDFTLTARQIALGQTFPLDLGFRFATSEPDFAVRGQISALLFANEALDQFAMRNLKSDFDLSGEPFDGRSHRASITGNLEAHLATETAAISDLSLRFANLRLNTNLNVQGFGDQPQLSGNLELLPFSLRELLATLGQEPVETADPDVLKRIAFATQIGGPAGRVELSGLSITLDDTVFDGSARYGLSDGAIGLTLNGNSINVDRYLPPASDEEETAATPEDTGPETDLLPLETLRALALDINLGLQQLQASGLTISDIAARITADQGVLKVERFGGNLYEGGFNANVTLDARTDNPSWLISSRVNNVQVLPLLQDLAEVDLISGGANLRVDLNTQGNRLSVLQNNAKGEIGFNLAEGAFTQMNLTRMACQGIALANQEALTVTEWGETTRFNDMSGTLKIDGTTLTNPDLVAALAGIRLEGQGTVDTSTSRLNYELGLRIVGDIHSDRACRVSDVVKNVIIPVECRGNFVENPAGLCSFDGSRFRDTLRDIAANIARQRAREEGAQIRQQAEDRVREELEQRLDEETRDRARDAVRGLIRR
ncbi:MAG: AsmA family protein [Marinobacter sp.]|nr:AsmA family protein [Marinobacter sp.]